VRLDGTSASVTIEGATDTESSLVPALRVGDIVIMDNLGAHKNDHLAVIAPSRRRGSLLSRLLAGFDYVERM
jgi:hypothetical protein